MTESGRGGSGGRSLEQWLDWQQSLHPVPIDLGLDRAAAVADALGLRPLPCVVVTVAGTNGKGSSIAMLEAIYRVAGYDTAAFTSPHLHRYNERLRLSGVEATDDAWVDAFERVDAARGDISLTYFEFGTLAALWLIARRRPDIALLEVGLGGRLDAVNIIDADVALITTIALDHQQWLGDDRDSIAAEKAGILRAAVPAVFGEPELPDSIRTRAAQLDVPLRWPGHGFGYQLEDDGGGWRWRGVQGLPLDLPLPAIPGRQQLANAAAVLGVIEALQPRVAVPVGALVSGLQQAHIAGRMQVIDGAVPVVLDVAHNPQAVAALAANLTASPVTGATRAVIAVLDDKDLDGMLALMLPQVDDWYCCALSGNPRALSADAVMAALVRLSEGGPATRVSAWDDPQAAFDAALMASSDGDRVLVFGSFFTVAAIQPG